MSTVPTNGYKQKYRQQSFVKNTLYKNNYFTAGELIVITEEIIIIVIIISIQTCLTIGHRSR